MKIGHIEHEIITFLVPGTKMYLLLVLGSKPRFLVRTSHFLPARDIGGKIKCHKNN